MEQQTDIAIVGAGLVGSTLACTLAVDNPDLSISLLEANHQIKHFEGDDFDPRVVALTAQSVDALQKCGAWPLILADRACPYRTMEVWDGEGTGSIAFDRAELQRENLGFIVEVSVAVRALRQIVDQLPNVHLRAPSPLKSMLFNEHDGSLLTTEDGAQLRAALVVGADGARSVVRSLAGISIREWDYQHSAIIATVRTELPHKFTARQRFSHDGPLALLPLQRSASQAESNICSIVWSLKHELAATQMALDDAAFCQSLGATFEHKLGDVLAVDRRHCLPLRQMHAKDYTAPGLALVGDAAHTIHPLAGQGVNLGVYDAQALAAEIARAQQRGVALTDASILKRYQRTRKSHNLAAMAAMEGFKRLFGSETLWALALRNRGLSWADQSGWLKRSMMEIAAGKTSS